MYSDLFTLRKPRPTVGMGLPSELVPEHGLDPGLLLWVTIYPAPSGSFPEEAALLLCPLVPTRGLPASLTPCFLPTWSPVLRCSYGDVLSPHGRPLKWWYSPLGGLTTQLITQATVLITSASCPAPQLWSWVPFALPPPTSTHSVLTFSSGLLTAFRKQAVRATGSSAKQSCLGHGNPGQTGEV